MRNCVVMDTNVFIAALLSANGDNREVLRLCLRGEIRPLMGAALFSEYEDVIMRDELMKNCPLKPGDRQALLEAFLSVCEWVRVYFLWRPSLPDESDNHLVELAVAGGADTIITNNVRDLTRGELRFPELEILTPRQFLSAAKKRS